MREYVISRRQFRLLELRPPPASPAFPASPSSPSVDNERQETRKKDKMFVATENKQKSAFRTVVFVVCCVALVMDILFSLLTILKTLKWGDYLFGGGGCEFQNNLVGRWEIWNGLLFWVNWTIHKSKWIKNIEISEHYRRRFYNISSLCNFYFNDGKNYLA